MADLTWNERNPMAANAGTKEPTLYERVMFIQATIADIEATMNGNDIPNQKVPPLALTGVSLDGAISKLGEALDECQKRLAEIKRLIADNMRRL